MDFFLKVIGIIALFLGLGLLLNYPFMLLINYLFAPSFLGLVFGVTKLTFWKTYALSVLLALVFKSVK